MSPRIVMHVDMDAFYASVELRRRPGAARTAGHRRRVPPGRRAVGDVRGAGAWRTVRDVLDRRRGGWPRGPPSSTPDFDSYTAVSKAIVAVFGTVTSVVESASIDEAFLDLTGVGADVRRAGADRGVRAGGRGRRAADHLLGRHRADQVRRQGGLPGSQAGRTARGARRTGSRLSSIRCRWRRCGAWATRRREKLHRLGIYTVGDLAAHATRHLAPRPSARTPAACCSELAWGRDRRRVMPAGARAQRRLAADVRPRQRRSR